jgi:hypothetical protein
VIGGKNEMDRTVKERERGGLHRIAREVYKNQIIKWSFSCKEEKGETKHILASLTQ